MPTFSMTKVLRKSFDEAKAALPEVLKSEGFGVLTHIDVKATMKQKLDVDFRRYEIFGACNPPLAHKALSAEIGLGVMLPCNVVLFEDDQQRTVASAIDPTATLAAQGSPVVEEVATEVRARLERVLAKLE